MDGGCGNGTRCAKDEFLVDYRKKDECTVFYVSREEEVRGELVAFTASLSGMEVSLLTSQPYRVRVVREFPNCTLREWKMLVNIFTLPLEYTSLVDHVEAKRVLDNVRHHRNHLFDEFGRKDVPSWLLQFVDAMRAMSTQKGHLLRAVNANSPSVAYELLTEHVANAPEFGVALRVLLDQSDRHMIGDRGTVTERPPAERSCERTGHSQGRSFFCVLFCGSDG